MSTNTPEEPESAQFGSESPDALSPRPSFAVKVTTPGRSHPQGRSDFWDALLSRPAAGAAVAYDDRFERDLREKFGPKLVNEARLFRESRLKDYPRHGPAGLPGFSFRVHNIRYGSLFFDVPVIGAGALAKYFFSDPDLVLAFLNTCVPQAFCSSVGMTQRGGVEIEVFENDALINAIQPRVSIDTAAAGPPQKATWADVMRRASQIAWLLPIILALAVLYVAAGMLSAERDRIHAREAALDGRTQQLQKSYDERIAKIEALTLDLVKQLRLAEDRKSDTCCPVCCPVPQQCNPHPPPKKKPSPCKR